MRKLFLFVLILTFGIAAPLFAIDPVKAYVPFEFMVENTSLAPGNYTFTQAGSFTASKVWNMAKHDGMFVIANYALRTTIPEVTTEWTQGVPSDETTGMKNRPTQPSEDAYCSLMFKKYGDTYFLKNVWTGLQGREFREGKLERQMKMAGIPGQTVVLVAQVH